MKTKLCFKWSMVQSTHAMWEVKSRSSVWWERPPQRYHPHKV